ncbi:MAG: hypothetical protein AVDCRST_MAG69-1418, partial [uncultured Solirubrobacteraceae bacterium]
GLPDPDGDRPGGRDGQHHGRRSVSDLLSGAPRAWHPAADRQRDQHVRARPHRDRRRAGVPARAARAAVSADLPGRPGRVGLAGRRRPAARLPGRDLRAPDPLPDRRLLAAGLRPALGHVAGRHAPAGPQPRRAVVQHPGGVLLRRLLRRCGGGALPRPRRPVLQRHHASAQRAQERADGDRQRGGDGRLRLPRRSHLVRRGRAGDRVADRRGDRHEAGALRARPRAAGGDRRPRRRGGAVDRPHL